MTEEKIRAMIELDGVKAAPKLAAQFERLKPAPWRERLAERSANAWEDFGRWYPRATGFHALLILLGVLATLGTVFGGIASLVRRSDAEQNRVYRLCLHGNKEACATYLGFSNITDSSRNIAQGILDGTRAPLKEGE